MAHYAEIDKTNRVLRVIVVDNEKLLVDGVESEEKGADFCHSLFGGKWIQTSYNTHGNQHPEGRPLYKNYAGIGSLWDGTGFYAPQPYPSWTKNEDTYLWESPVPYPIDGKIYYWDESSLSWIEKQI